MSCCCIDVDCFCEIFEDKVRYSRKEHVCCECKKTIVKGEFYSYEKTLYEGAFTEYKTCTTCRKIRDEFLKCGWHYCDMWEDLYYCWDTNQDEIGP